MKERCYQNPELNRNVSTALKGIAILLMLVHHGLGLPAMWFEEGLGYGQRIYGDRMLFEWVGNPTKICVSVFAFLTGWGYFYNAEKNLRYGIKKSLRLLTKYWVVLFVIFYPLGYLVSGYIPSFKSVVFNLFSVHNRVVSFSWYILFYIICICTLPVWIHLATGKVVVDVGIIPLFFAGMVQLSDHIVVQKWYLLAVMRDYFCWIQVVWIGYLVARYGFFDRMRKRLEHMPKIAHACMLVLLMAVRGMLSEWRGINLDILYAPLFIYSCKALLREDTVVFKGLFQLGKHSLHIWLIHAIFFWEGTRAVFQPLVYGVNQPVVTILLILFFSLIPSVLLDWLWNCNKKYAILKRLNAEKETKSS